MDQVPVDELTGAADYPQIWNQGPREGLSPLGREQQFSG